MRRGPLFRLLGLERHLCPSCHRDNVHRVWGRRPGAPRMRQCPTRCRWCGESMVDWAAMTRCVRDLAAIFGSFGQMASVVVQAMNSIGAALPGTVWTVDVETATHDDLRVGETATRISRVQVFAPDEVEAKLVACQMVAREGRMPTRATVRTSLDLLCEAQANQPHLQAVDPNPLRHAVELRRDVP